MKSLPRTRHLALFLFGLLATAAPAPAQTNVFLTVVRPTNAIPVNGTLTYQIYITNAASFPLTDPFVTNAFSSSVRFLAATNDHGGGLGTNGNALIFHTIQINGVEVNHMALSVRALTAGLLTNTVTLSAPLQLASNIVAQVVNQVTNVPGAPADLALGITLPHTAVYSNDWMTYSLVVSNLGPNTATNVFLTNNLSGLSFISASPAPQSSSSPQLFKLGNLTNQAIRNFQVTVQAGSAGSTNGVSAFVDATGTVDSNTANNRVTTNIVVSDFLTNLLVAVTNDATQVFNAQVGLMEQGILLSNASPDPVPSARVMVSGIPSGDRLFNAVGTNNGVPFVEYAATLDANASIGLLLQFKVPTHETFDLPNSNLVARGVAAVDRTPPASLINAFSYTRITNLNSRMLIEFQSTNGASYAVVYADDLTFTNAQVARPFVVAPANWTYWYDYGPPVTTSAPTNSTSRFYRIYQVPP